MNGVFHQILSQLRKKQQVSQRQVAADLYISQALLSHYENGIREPGLDFVNRACNYYGVSADYLLGRSPEHADSSMKSALAEISHIANDALSVTNALATRLATLEAQLADLPSVKERVRQKENPSP